MDAHFENNTHYALIEPSHPDISPERINMVLIFLGHDPADWTITEEEGVYQLHVFKVVVAPDGTAYRLFDSGLEEITI